MRPIHPAVLAGLLAFGGCSSLPPALAPTPAPAYSARELQGDIEGVDRAHDDYGEDASLLTPAGDVVHGRDAILSYLASITPRGVAGFQFFPQNVYRCGPAEGTEIGSYRVIGGVEKAGDESGGWYARWRRSSDGDWKIVRATLARVGAALPRADSACVGTSAEVAAGARFTLAVHVPPFEIDTSHPQKDLQGVGRYPFRATDPTGFQTDLTVRYRLSSWLTVAASWERERRFRSDYAEPRTETSQGRSESLLSTGSMYSVMAGYEGRNVFVTAGPALFRSDWQWSESSGLPDAGGAYGHAGAVVDAGIVIPLEGGLNLDVLARRRFVGDDVVPRTSLRRSWRGFLLGVGFSLRETER